MAEPVTVNDLQNAKLDVDTIAEIATSNLETATDRLGNIKNTLYGALKFLGYEPPVVYAGAILFASNDNTKTIDESGVIYAPLPSALPFTTSGTFIGDDDARFFVVQGLSYDGVFDTVAQLSADVTLLPGLSVSTLGYYSAGDGGGASYLIVAPQAADEFGNHTLANSNVALLQTLNDVDIPKQWGAKADTSVSDDSPVFRAMASAGVKNVSLGNNTYGMLGGVEFPQGTSFRGNSSEFSSQFYLMVGYDSITYPSLLRFRSDNPAGVACSGLHISGIKGIMNGIDAHFVEILKAYDNCLISDITVKALGDNSSCLRLIPDPLNPNSLSQSITIHGVTGNHLNTSATAPTFYFDRCQELTMTGVKAFGGPAFPSQPDLRTFHFYNCRGVQMIGCSSALTNGAAILINTDSDGVTDGPDAQDIGGISIFGHTFESIHDDGSSKSYGVLVIASPTVNTQGIDINLIQPRWQLTFGANFVAAKYVNVIRGHVDAIGYPVDFDDNTIECHAVVSLYEHAQSLNSNRNSAQILAGNLVNAAMFTPNIAVKSEITPGFSWRLGTGPGLAAGTEEKWQAKWNASSTLDNGWQLEGNKGDLVLTSFNPVAGTVTSEFQGKVGVIKASTPTVTISVPSLLGDLGVKKTWEMRWNASTVSDEGVSFTGPYGDTCFTMKNRSTGGAQIGFLGSPAVPKLPVTGSRAGTAALESLLARLEQYGLIDDNTTA